MSFETEFAVERREQVERRRKKKHLWPCCTRCRRPMMLIPKGARRMKTDQGVEYAVNWHFRCWQDDPKHPGYSCSVTPPARTLDDLWKVVEEERARGGVL